MLLSLQLLDELQPDFVLPFIFPREWIEIEFIPWTFIQITISSVYRFEASIDQELIQT